MDLAQLSEVFIVNLGIQLRARVQWRLSFFLDMLVTAIWMGIYVLFWRILLVNFLSVGGWTFPSLVIFVGFQELTYGINAGLFSGAMRFWVYINTGRLDVALARPMDARLSAILLNIDPWQLIRSGLMFTLFTALAVKLGLPFNPPAILAAIILSFFAAIAKTLLALTINYIAFWWGNVDFLHELIGTLDHFTGIPMTMLPNILQLLFTLGIPLMFAVTFPTLFISGKVSWNDFGLPLVGLGISLSFWVACQEYLWRKGLKAYESFGG